jgi:glycosyltransferase involved in cell wall biosynthesis
MRTIRREKLSKNVSIMGHVAYDELLSHVSRASVAVFPTFLEVGPFISALEAMACRKPIVVFDLPFNREFIQHMKTGVMAKAGDMEDFISKIAFLLSNEDLRKDIGEAAYTYVRQNHNWKYLVNSYIKIYEGAVNS